MESPIDAARGSMENARTAMEKLDHYIEGLVEMQQREPENWEHAEALMTLAQTLTDLANDANPVVNLGFICRPSWLINDVALAPSGEGQENEEHLFRRTGG